MSGRLGFLAVSSQPSSQLPIAEFHEWYEDEHIPLRLDHLPEFLAGARFKVHSRRTRNQLEKEEEKAEGPSWLALYFVDSPSVFSAPNYTSLRTNRSEREKGILSRIEVMTRLTGEVLGVWSGNEDRTSGFHPGRPSGSIVTQGLSVRRVGLNAMDEIKSWMSCIQRGTANSQEINNGWARTHLICVLESGTSHFGINVEVEAESTMDYFVVHEFVNTESAQSFIGLMVDSPDSTIELGEWTLWELYKAYPCLAQSNSHLSFTMKDRKFIK